MLYRAMKQPHRLFGSVCCIGHVLYAIYFENFKTLNYTILRSTVTCNLYTVCTGCKPVG